MNVSFNPAQLRVGLGNPVSRYVVEPYISVEETEDGVEITCTSHGETTTGEVYNGVSPNVTVTAITGGHEVSITDKDGTHTFDVMDGVDGTTPEISATAVGLAAGATPYAHVSGTADQPLITFGIPKGDKGDPGTTTYSALSDKPSINNVVLSGNKSLHDLGIAAEGDIPVVPVQSVNGKTGAVVLSASDVGALPDSYTAPVSSVNNKTGAVSLDASDVGALPDDTVVSKVEQTETTTSGYSNWRSVLVSYGSNSTWNGSIPTSTNLVRHFQNLRFQPSTGTLRATTFVGSLTGTASGNLKSGDNVSSLTNDAGYLTLATLPVWDGGVT